MQEDSAVPMSDSDRPESLEAEEAEQGPVAYTCKHCPAMFPRTPEGQRALATHSRVQHKSRGGRTERSQDPSVLEGLTPLAERLHRTAARLLPKNPGMVDTMVESFNQAATRIGNSRYSFRSWISRYGLTSDIGAALEDAMFGPDLPDQQGQGQPGGALPGGGQIAYVPGPGGAMTPIIIMGQGGAQPATPGGPTSFSFQLPQGYGGQSDSRLDRLERMMESMMTQMHAPPHHASQVRARMRKVKRPLAGPEGLLCDSRGRPVYEETEEPYDPQAAQQGQIQQTFEMMTNLIHSVMPQAATPPVDEEKLLLKLKNELGSLKREHGADPETRADIQALSRTVAELLTLQREGAARTEGYQAAKSELLPELEALKRRLDDTPGQLSERAVMGRDLTRQVREAAEKVTSELKDAMTMQSMMAGVQSGAVDKEVFNSYMLGRAGAAPSPPSEAQKAQIISRIRK